MTQRRSTPRSTRPSRNDRCRSRISKVSTASRRLRTTERPGPLRSMSETGPVLHNLLAKHNDVVQIHVRGRVVERKRQKGRSRAPWQTAQRELLVGVVRNVVLNENGFRVPLDRKTTRLAAVANPKRERTSASGAQALSQRPVKAGRTHVSTERPAVGDTRYGAEAQIATLTPAGKVTGFKAAVLYEISRYHRAVRKGIDVRWRRFLLLRHCNSRRQNNNAHPQQPTLSKHDVSLLRGEYCEPRRIQESYARSLRQIETSLAHCSEGPPSRVGGDICAAAFPVKKHAGDVFSLLHLCCFPGYTR